MRGLLIPIDPSVPISSVEVSDTYPQRLSTLRELIGGGWIEMVHTNKLMDTIDRAKSPRLYRIVMIVDEEGAGRLPQNPRASLLYAPGKAYIFGPALIFAEVRDELEGNDIFTLPDYYTPDYLTEHLNSIN